MASKGQSNGYVSIVDLQQIKPAAEDLVIDGRKYRCRGLLSGEVHRIGKACRGGSLPATYDDHLDSVMTVCYGLVKPHLQPKSDAEMEAAQLIVQGMPNALRIALTNEIVRLTRITPVLSTEAEPGRGEAPEPEEAPEQPVVAEG